MAYEIPLTIAEVMKDISNNKYVLPSIQREYVWDTEQIEALFDSLMQDYPIGTFLFWEVEKSRLQDYDFYEFLKSYHEKNNTHNEKINLKGSDGVTAVLDGQQRLTSIYIGLKGSYTYRLRYKQKKSESAYPIRYLYLNLLDDARDEDENNKYDFRFLTDKEYESMADGYWYRVGDVLNMSQPGDTSQYVFDHIAFVGTHTKEQVMHANNALQKLYNVVHTDKTLSYYREKATELDKVLNIFIRVNNGGTKLTYSDLLLSIASAQWENHDAREEITEFVDEINAIGGGFRTNKDFVLKTALVLTDFPNIAFKVDNFNKQNMMKIEKNWDNIKRTIRQSVNLVSSFGYTGETLSSNNALIPIAYYLHTIGIPNNFVESSAFKENRAKIKKWLIMALLKKAFGGQPDNVIRPIRDIIRKNGNNDFPISEIIDEFKGTNKSILFTEDDIDEYLLKLKYGKSGTLSTFMLLYPSLNFSNKFHEDHMYPKSKFKKPYLRKMGVPEDKLDTYIASVNDISNLQLLDAQLNEEKLDTDFDVWFNEKHVTDTDKIQYRMLHYLPDMEYTYPNFLTFLDKRKQLIRKKLKEILL